jgi:hypothetical protein
MKLAAVRRFSAFLCLSLILGCGDGSDPSLVSDAGPAPADPQPAPPETGVRKAPPNGPTAVRPTPAY